ncbi:nicotinate phosphoribosyltransferase [Nitrosomonas sp. Nm51]|uniref:nicotinate phosphoribosyltransferase n=1 Tax=Nitrosomonas sp. Nm51 TaxID=133720 RepID=UPI0008B7B8CA|nr:nicotinate phosphoribosyltransferase [Nitrosomonas sp. Nm51]SER69834.1 nicotinate phosphoribosyltransferase [Nitrosomonas sp. Nm51]
MNPDLYSCGQCSPLLTDFYQLTMLQSYIEHGMEDTAVFEMFVRKLPNGRNFLVAAGLEQVLDYLEHLQFSEDELAWLATRFPPHVIDYLRQFRFTGDVHALPEGTVFFPNEPVIRITAPLPQAQLVESRIINLLHFETLIASKAARSVLAAPDKTLVDFGMRRAHGLEAGLLAARASYLAGFSGTATVLAGAVYGVPLYGTMAHSYIQAHEDELAAFEHFARSHPDNAVLLIDTYDTENAAARLVGLADKLAQDRIHIKGVRLDSGDLAEHARNVRRILDRGGLTKATIFASGNIDEYRLHTLVRSGAPIDGFGIGTSLDISSDAPALDCAYKLQEYAGKPRRKHSEGKATWPGRKQVLRNFGTCNHLMDDTVVLEDEDWQAGKPLIKQFMQAGRRVQNKIPLDDIRKETLSGYAELPEIMTLLDSASTYPVTISENLHRLADQLDAEHAIDQ